MYSTTYVYLDPEWQTHTWIVMYTFSDNDFLTIYFVIEGLSLVEIILLVQSY